MRLFSHTVRKRCCSTRAKGSNDAIIVTSYDVENLRSIGKNMRLPNMRLPIFAVLLGFIGALSTSAYSQVMNESDCQLEYLKGVQSTLAVNLINGACRHLSNWSSTMELGRNERLYNECLLTKLQGVLNDQAATWVAQACRKKNSFSL